jgi:hypothetical protein
MKKNLLMPVLALSVAGATLIGANAVFAQSSIPPQEQSIVQKIAQRFNLQEKDVQAVFDDHRSNRHAAMQQKLDARLTQAVKDGKITEVQKQAILKKFQDMKALMGDRSQLKNMSPEQRKQMMEQKKAELESWAKENNLEVSTLQELLGRKGFGHKGFGMRNGSATPSAMPSN